MKTLLPGLILSLAATLCSPALAALKTGDKAPDFTAPAMLGGKDFTFHLAEALKKGPVVVYFYPAAFTSGCTVEAHDFAEAMPQYQALGAPSSASAMTTWRRWGNSQSANARAGFRWRPIPAGSS